MAHKSQRRNKIRDLLLFLLALFVCGVAIFLNVLWAAWLL